MTEATNQSNDLENVMRRVKKLLAIAEDGRANAEEASAAAGMAERIMRKYQIEHADILAVELTRGGAESFSHEDVGSTLNPEGYSQEASGWAGILGVAVAQLHDCQARYVKTIKHGKTLRFQGFAADAQMARFTYLYLVAAMNAAAKQFTKEGDCDRRDLTDFRRGFNSAVCALLANATQAKKREMQEASSSRALVIAKDRAVAEHFGAVKYRSTGQRRGGDAFREGQARGSKVDVTRSGLSGGGSSRAQLS